MLTLDLMNPEQRCIIMMIKHRLIELNKYYIYRGIILIKFYYLKEGDPTLWLEGGCRRGAQRFGTQLTQKSCYIVRRHHIYLKGAVFIRRHNKRNII